MSGITDPSEEYFKNGLWGWVADQWKKLIGDDAGHLQVDVVESDLPSGAATSAHQTTMITALQLIDDLRAALNSVAGDELDVVIDGQTADVEIKQTAPADLTPGVHGWDGAAWRKLPIIWGYSGRYYEAESNESASAGINTLTFSTIPVGEVWAIQGVAAHNKDSVITRILIAAVTPLGTMWLHWKESPPAFAPVELPQPVILTAGCYLACFFYGCNLNDDIFAYAWGYKMKVAE